MTVINKYHHGNAVPADAVNIMRGTLFQNPFRLNIDGDRRLVLMKYVNYLENRLQEDPAFRQEVLGLHGLDLCCVCAPKPCHGDALQAAAMRLYVEKERQELMDSVEEDRQVAQEFLDKHAIPVKLTATTKKKGDCGCGCGGKNNPCPDKEGSDASTDRV